MNKESRDFHTYLRGIILIGFMLLLIGLITTGKLNYYVAPKMHIFVYFAIGILGILGVMQFFRRSDEQHDDACGCGVDHTPKGRPLKHFFIYMIFVIPLLTGFMIPEKAMDSSVAEKRGIRYGTGLYAKPAQKTEEGKVTTTQNIDVEAYLDDPEGYIKEMEKNVKEENPVETYDVTAYYKKFGKEQLAKDKVKVTSDHYLDTMTVLDIYLDKFKGKEIETTGFVYREDGMSENQAVIARFSMNCCSADAVVYGTIIEGDGVSKLKEDEWYTVTGTIDETELNKVRLPLVEVESLEKIKPLKDPYVYPSPESLGAY
ncbi:MULTISPECIES: TIGR03943 family putative permease subunit [Fictibacillus]|uniref:TIGR03943 family putative permease subunit n=1 Tax=Fictibacillus TaxID=1329200 RepID=UPI0018CF3DBD|nr:TIGR03943 family protein [Fictibacillus sp. 26RED30]MBH0162152.1 TIGR03943 family protein [Fictibacillus sp. 26RED30]